MRYFTFSSIFFFFFVLLSDSEMAASESTTIGVNVGLILDLDTNIGKIGLSSTEMAVEEFYASHADYKTRLNIHVRDSEEDVVAATAAAVDLIRSVQVEAIIGPQKSIQSNFVIDLGDKAKVPIISFSATSPSLTSTERSYFVRATQSDKDQVKVIQAIVEAFGWGQAVPIYEDDGYREKLVPYLIDSLEEVRTRVPYRSAIPPNATDDEIVRELYKLMTMQTRVFIVHMLPLIGQRLFTKAKEVGMMDEGYVWIMTDGMTNHLCSMDAASLDSMQGALGVTTQVPPTKEAESFSIRWKKRFRRDYPSIVNPELSIHGLRAYDAAWALAMAVEKFGSSNLWLPMTDAPSSSTNLDAFGVSQNGPKLLQELSGIRFKGLAGDFHFVNRQLGPSSFRIVNVNDAGGRTIGYWTRENGLVKELNKRNNTYSTSKKNLKPIIWPGDSTSVPRGWEIPTKGKKLRIAVPQKNGFSEFVEVIRDPSSNTTKVTGFCIDVFEAVIAALPYAVTYEFFPFSTEDGKPAGSYNDLIKQVYLQNYDAVVGDITIAAERSFYVDFTLPYTASGISLVVPVKENKKENAWAFLKPLTWDLWVTSTCFFIFIGFVVWVLEHRINEDFRGPLSHQVGTSFWFSFSTMVFAHGERVVSNLARFVLIIWFFLVLILSQSYTASLISLLTVQQLQPIVTDIDKLRTRGEYVGYSVGTFIFEKLKAMGFNENKLRSFNSSESCDDLLSKGSTGGGISAAFDEVPYMRLLVSKNCSKYAMSERVIKTDGFGFVFPKGSPLVPDMSRAILNVIEGKKMEQIERAWFGTETSCPDTSRLVSDNSLGLESFWGLFLIAGVAASLSLITFMAIFLYEHRHVIFLVDWNPSIWKRIVILFKHYDEKDHSSQTFRKSELPSRSPTGHGVDTSVVQPSPDTQFVPTPSSFSNHTDANSVFEDI